MQREFNVAEQSFRRQVAEFFADNWPADWPRDYADTSARQRAAWRAALLARGWSVPHWPVHAGGAQWSATQKFIWQQACAAHGIDAAADPGAAIVGPLLLAANRAAQQRAFLPGIRQLAVRWCVGYAEPDVGTDLMRLSTSARFVAGAYRIDGVKTWVSEAVDADWMCCLARVGGGGDFALFAVDLHSPGVTVEPLRTLEGAAAMAVVSMQDVQLSAHQLLHGPGDGAAYAQLIVANEYSTLGRGAMARAQLDVLDASLAGFDPDDGLHARRNAVAVDLAGLEALELRFLDALAEGCEPPFPLALLRLKSREILLQLGALQVECFGYYALPYPDQLLLHNEGPVGPDAATASVRSALAQQVAALCEGSGELLKDEMARHLKFDDE